MPKLVIFRGDAVENETRLTGHTVRIGRDKANDIVLDDKSVSRFHAEVRAEAGKHFIVDLKSRNGLWMNGEQLKAKAALALGVPVTLGAYEVALEDDGTTVVFDEEAPLPNQPTVVNAASVNQPARSTRSVTSSSSTPGSSTRGPSTGGWSIPKWSKPSPGTPTNRQALVWGGVAAVILLVIGVTFAVSRYRNVPAPTAEIVAPPPLPESPPQSSPPNGDSQKQTIDRLLAAARAAMGNQDFAAARSSLSPVLELDPGNPEALALMQQADAGAANLAPPPIKRPNPEVAAAISEIPGIPPKAGEDQADYNTRVQRIQVNFQEGKNSLAKQDFALAVVRFQAVDRDQKGYPGLDSLMADALARQRRAVDEAIQNGQKNEQADRLVDALKWYQQAQVLDPNSTTARDKIAGLAERVTKIGSDAYNFAEVFRKRGDSAKALQYYKQAVDALPRGTEKSRDSQKWLETLKP